MATTITSITGQLRGAINELYDNQNSARLNDLAGAISLIAGYVDNPLAGFLRDVANYAYGAAEVIVEDPLEEQEVVISPFTNKPMSASRGANVVSINPPVPDNAQQFNLVQGFGLKDLDEGFYTVVMGDEYRTLRLRSWSAKPGHKVISYLNGPDNTSDYIGIGDVNEHGYVNFWRRWENRDNMVVRAVLQLSKSDKDGIADSRENYALKSGRCAICGRMLTVPASIYRGIGPDCAARISA